jgi:hypothetical protein
MIAACREMSTTVFRDCVGVDIARSAPLPCYIKGTGFNLLTALLIVKITLCISDSSAIYFWHLSINSGKVSSVGDLQPTRIGQ